MTERLAEVSLSRYIIPSLYVGWPRVKEQLIWLILPLKWHRTAVVLSGYVSLVQTHCAFLFLLLFLSVPIAGPSGLARSCHLLEI